MKAKSIKGLLTNANPTYFMRCKVINQGNNSLTMTEHNMTTSEPSDSKVNTIDHDQSKNAAADACDPIPF